MAMLALPIPHLVSDIEPHEPFIPIKYVTFKRVQGCACCDRVHEWCELFVFCESRSRNGYSRVENWHRIDWPKYDLPIEQRDEDRCDIVPFCHDCYEPSLAMTPNLL